MDVPEVPLRAQDCRIAFSGCYGKRNGVIYPSIAFTNLLKSLIVLCGCRARTLRSDAGSAPVT